MMGPGFFAAALGPMIIRRLLILAGVVFVAAFALGAWLF